MISLLFSQGHLNTAKEIFPDRYGKKRWHLKPWKFKEIVEIKENEPRVYDRSQATLSKNQQATFDFLNQNAKGKCLSLGCGSAIIEFNLIEHSKTIEKIDCYDYEDSILPLNNQKTQDENIFFFKSNVLDIYSKDKYDCIMLNSLIYALDNNSLDQLIKKMNDLLSENGTLYIFSPAGLTFRKWIYTKKIISKIILGIKGYESYKPTGYLRTKNEITSILRKNKFKGRPIHLENCDLNLNFEAKTIS